MVKNVGYVYLCGRGTIETRQGRTYLLGYDGTTYTWLPRLKSEDQLEREGAALALGWLASTREEVDKVIPALIEALNDDAMEVRRGAAESLGRIGDPQALEALTMLVDKEKNTLVRKTC